MGSVVVAHRLKLLRSLWDLPGPGLEPLSPALAGGFLTTAPPEKPWILHIFIELFIYFYLPLAALGLCCCTQAFSSCGERGLLFLVVHGLLIAVASLVVEHGL